MVLHVEGVVVVKVVNVVEYHVDRYCRHGQIQATTLASQQQGKGLGFHQSFNLNFHRNLRRW